MSVSTTVLCLLSIKSMEVCHSGSALTWEADLTRVSPFLCGMTCQSQQAAWMRMPVILLEITYSEFEQLLTPPLMFVFNL